MATIDNQFSTKTKWGAPNQETHGYEKGWHVTKHLIEFHKDFWPSIKVIGAGAAGCNAIYRMGVAGLRYIDMIAIIPDQEKFGQFTHRMANAEIGFGTSVYTTFGTLVSLDKADVVIIVADIEDRASLEIIRHITDLAKLNGATTVAVISNPAANYDGLLTKENYYLSPFTPDHHCLDDINTLVIIPGKALNDRNMPLVDPFWMAEEPLWRTVQCITNFADPFLGGLNKEDYKFLLTSGDSNTQIGRIGMGFGDGEKAFDAALDMCLKTGVPMKKDNKYFVNCIFKKNLDWRLDFYFEAKKTLFPENTFFEVATDRCFQHDIYVTTLCLNSNI